MITEDQPVNVINFEYDISRGKYPGINVGRDRKHDFRTRVRNNFERVLTGQSFRQEFPDQTPRQYWHQTVVLVSGGYGAANLPKQDSDLDLIFVGANPSLDHQVMNHFESQVELLESAVPYDLHYVQINKDEDGRVRLARPVANLGLLDELSKSEYVEGRGSAWVDLLLHEITTEDYERIALYGMLAQGESARGDLSRTNSEKYAFGGPRTVLAILNMLRISASANDQRLLLHRDAVSCIEVLGASGKLSLAEAELLLRAISENVQGQISVEDKTDVVKLFNKVSEGFLDKLSLANKDVVVASWRANKSQTLTECLDACPDDWLIGLGVAMSKYATQEQLARVRQANQRKWQDDYLEQRLLANAKSLGFTLN